MKLETMTLGPLQTNCYLAWAEGSGRCAVIDPGGESRRICAELEKRGLTPDVILLTHAHADHVRGLWHLYEKTGACVYVHAGELDARINIGPFRFVPPPKTQYVCEGGTICAGSLRFSVLECPGHTPGSVAYRCEDTLFTGDTLLHMGSGRVDYPCSSREDMIASLSRLCGLSGDYRICPGHGEETTLGYERAHNPALLPGSGYFDPPDEWEEKLL